MEPTTALTAPKSSKPVRVLVVDDDRPMLESMARGLKRAGYEVIEATSGEQGLQLALSFQPDIAVLDVRMPGMSGLELALAIREQTTIPFLFASVHGDSEVTRVAAEYGALGYLIKPVDAEQLAPAIEAALARARDIRRLEESEAQLTVALSKSRETSIVVGILVERYRVDRHAAFELLREHARAQRLKIGEVAAELLRSAESLNLKKPAK